MPHPGVPCPPAVHHRPVSPPPKTNDVSKHKKETFPLTRLGELDLLLNEVSNAKLSVESLERCTLDNVDRVDDVSERLAHLAAVSVADHGVA